MPEVALARLLVVNGPCRVEGHAIVEDEQQVLPQNLQRKGQSGQSSPVQSSPTQSNPIPVTHGHQARRKQRPEAAAGTQRSESELEAEPEAAAGGKAGRRGRTQRPDRRRQEQRTSRRCLTVRPHDCTTSRLCCIRIGARRISTASAAPTASEFEARIRKKNNRTSKTDKWDESTAP